jgi:AcrR family transcriptional regulator
MAMAFRSERADRSRQAIIDAACPIFHERGYAGASLNEIIRASGLTKGGFYFHFPSKEALAVAVVRDGYDRWGRRAFGAAQAEPRAIDRLFAVPRAIAELEVRERGLASQSRLVEELSRDPRLREEVSEPIRGQIAIAAGLIREAQAEGDVRPEVDPDTIAELAIGAFNGLSTLTDELGDDGFRDRIEALIATVRTAIQTRPT